MRNKTAVFYSGQSMIGTFKEIDWLKIGKIKIEKVKIGDVVVFGINKNEDKKKHCVHRVVAIIGKHLLTRGDNNSQNDEEPATEENLIGKVTHYERNEKVYKVWNGKLGIMRARVLHGRLHIIRAVKFLLRKPYRMLKKTGIVATLWRPEIETIYFETQDGPLVKYMHKGKTVASCWTDSNRWWFRRPYDFVINTKAKVKEKR